MSAEKRKRIITPNALTILRIILSIIIIYLLFNPSFYVRLSLAFLFTAASLSDYFDGRIARKYGLITNFGKIVDPLADKVLYLGLFISFCILGVCPLWWVILIGIREVLVTVLRFVLLKQGTVIAADKFGKIKVAFQIGTVLFCWLCLLFREYAVGGPLEGFYGPLRIILAIFLFLTLIITLYSGFIFVSRNSNALADAGVARLAGTFFYFGNASVAPGTIGSVGGVLLYLGLWHNSLLYMLVLACVCVVGVWSSRHMCRLRNNSDPQEVVIDEVAGMLITLFFIPFTWLNVGIGFALFRLFDILKPWPIASVERIKHGYGVMLDDIIAGVFANFLMQVIYYKFLI